MEKEKYYKVIEGLKFDNSLLEEADDLVKGRGDGRISIDDSKLRSLGWKETADFDEEIKNVVRFYKENFIW